MLKKGFFQEPDENQDMEEIPGLPSLPKNISIEGAQFAVPGPKAAAPSKEGSSMNAAQVKAISSLVKITVKSFKEAEQQAEQQAEENEKKEALQKKENEQEEMRKRNEFRDAGMPMQAVPESVNPLLFAFFFLCPFVCVMVN